MSDISVEIASKMLAAIVYENEEPTDVLVENITIEEQMRYLKRYIDTVPVADRYDVGRLLLMNNKANFIVSCNEGVVIDMDKIPPYIVNQMYVMLKTKIERISK
jgi:hypothetical protein